MNRIPSNWFRIVIYLLVPGVLLVPSSPAIGQSESYAAVLTVLHDGVTVQRANTTEWIPLTSGSVAPFGVNDRLQTDKTGRAFVALGSDSLVLVLPESTYQLENLEIDASNRMRLEENLTGTAVHSMELISSYRLTMQDVVITQPATLFATWAEMSSPFAVTVANGHLKLAIAEENWSLKSGQGIYIQADSRDVVTFDSPWNIARMQGRLEGCPGVINTIGNVPLRVRTGPGEGFITMGAFEEAQTVHIMAINESLGWYRVQFLSGFGWMLKNAIQTRCENLPILADDTNEYPDFILDASSDEIDLLRPFFGSPVINGWFYQWSDNR